MRKKKKLYLAAHYQVYKPTTIQYSVVYYIKLRFSDGLALYKIGYTSMTIAKRVEGYFDRKTGKHTLGMGLPCGCTYKVIATLYKGKKATAYAYEQKLHNLYQAMRYRGPNRLANGNSELYLMDVLGLDTTK